MLISTKHGFAFLCTPKCASNSVEIMLGDHADIFYSKNPALRHMNYRVYSKHMGVYLEETLPGSPIETVCVVRDPISWLGSWYRFRSRSNLRAEKGGKRKLSTYGLSFVEFIEAYVSESPPPFARVGSQFDFVQDADGNVGVDRIFRYDRLPDLVSYFSEKTGTKLKLGVANMSSRSIHRYRITELAAAAISKFAPSRAYSAPVLPELPPDLSRVLEKKLSRDFELYSNTD